jgi:hypothetical protein
VCFNSRLNFSSGFFLQPALNPPGEFLFRFQALTPHDRVAENQHLHWIFRRRLYITRTSAQSTAGSKPQRDGTSNYN